MLMTVSVSAAVTITWPSGWSEDQQRNQTVGNDRTLGVARKIAASESGSYTPTVSGSGANVGCSIHVFRGADASGSQAASPAGVDETNQANPNPQNVTTDSDGALVFCASVAQASGGPTGGETPPTGMTALATLTLANAHQLAAWAQAGAAGVFVIDNWSSTGLASGTEVSNISTAYTAGAAVRDLDAAGSAAAVGDADAAVSRPLGAVGPASAASAANLSNGTDVDLSTIGAAAAAGPTVMALGAAFTVMGPAASRGASVLAVAGDVDLAASSGSAAAAGTADLTVAGGATGEAFTGWGIPMG